MANLGDMIMKVGCDITGFSAAMREVKGALNSSGGDFKKFGVTAGAGLGAIGASAFLAANNFNNAFVSIQNSTGATGTKLDALNKSFMNVYKQVDESSGQVSEALGLLATRTGATGKQLEGLTVKLLDVAKVQREGVGSLTPVITRAFGDWSIATNKQGGAMDFMGVASQQTGVKVARLAEQIVYAGAPLRELGYNFESATTLISKFEKEGVNTELVLGGMKAALQKFTKEGVADSAAEWQRWVAGVKNGTISFRELTELVGAKRGVDLFKAITEGRFEIDATVNSFRELSKEGVKTADTLKEKYLKLQHQFEATLGAHSELITTVGLAGPFALTLGRTLSTGLGGLVGSSGIVAGGVALGGAIAAYIGKGMADEFAKNHAWFGVLQSLASGGMYGTDLYAEPEYPKGAFESIKEHRAKMAAEMGTATKEVEASAKAIKKAYGELGVKDLRLELDEAVTAFNLLTAAGKLNSGQIADSENHIAKLRFELERAEAGFSATADKFRAIPFAEKSVAGAQLSERIQRWTTEWKALGEEAGKAGITIEDLLAKKVVLAKQSVQQFLATAEPMVNWAKATAAAGKEIDALTKEMVDLGIIVGGKLPDDIRDLNATAAALGVNLVKTNIPDLTDKYFELADAYDQNKISITALNQAYITLIKAKVAAGKAMDWEIAKVKELEEASTAGMRKTVRDRYDLGRELEQMTRRTFDAVGRDIARNIVQWKGWSESVKNIGKGLAEDFLSIMIKALFKPLEDQFAKIAGKLGTLLSGGGSSAAGTATTAAGGAASSGAKAAGAAGTVVSAGLAGIVSAVTGVITAVSSVIGNFQMAGMNKSLDLIEKATRYTEIYTGGQDDSILATSHEMRDTLRKILASTTGLVGINLSGTLSGEQSNQLISNLLNGSKNFYEDSRSTLLAILHAITGGTALIVGQLHAAANQPLWKQLLSGGLLSNLGGAIGGVLKGLGGGAGGFLGGLVSGDGAKLDLIANHTLRMFNEIYQQRIDHWDQHNGTFTRLGEIWNTLQDGGSGGGFTFTNCTFGAGTSKDQIQAWFREAVAARG